MLRGAYYTHNLCKTDLFKQLKDYNFSFIVSMIFRKENWIHKANFATPILNES